jgi:chromosome segregation ATPase
MNTALFFAISVAAASVAAAIHMWRRANANYTLLVESAGSFDTLRRDNERLRESARGQFDEVKRMRDGLMIARGDADAARRDQAANLERIRELEAELRATRERLGHERQQFIQQIESARNEIAQLRAAADQARNFAESGLAAELQAAREKSAAMAQKLERQEADVRAARDELSDTLDLMHKVKRRNAHLERLYQSMRGLKLMAEERSANFEHALKDLSSWTLSQKSNLPAGKIKELPMGELVGGALESIGKAMVEAEFESEADIRHES